MKKSLFKVFLMFLVIALASSTANARKIVIAEVNGKEIDNIAYSRLYKSRKEDFKKAFNFDLYSSLDRSNNKIKQKRYTLLKNAIKEEIKVDEYELSRKLTRFVREEGGVEEVKLKAGTTGTSINQIRRKLKENIALETYFDKHEKEKIINILVNEELVMQEAKRLGIKAKYNELQKALKAEIRKMGSEESFTNYLISNQATEQDALRELEKKIIYNKFLKKVSTKAIISEKEVKSAYKKNYSKRVKYKSVKEEIYKNLKIKKTGQIFKAYMKKKRNNASIIVYNNYQDNSLAYSFQKKENEALKEVKESKNPFEEDFLKAYFDR